MDWRVRIVWSLLPVVLFVAVLTPVEAGPRSGGRAVRSHGGRTGWGHQDIRTYKHDTSKQFTQTPILRNVMRTNHQGSRGQLPGPDWKAPGTNRNKQPPAPSRTMTRTSTTKQPLGPGRNITRTNVNKQLTVQGRNITVKNVNKKSLDSARTITRTNINKQSLVPSRNKTVTNIIKQTPGPGSKMTVTNINKQLPPTSRNKTVTNIKKQPPPPSMNKTVKNINKQLPPTTRTKTVTNINKQPSPPSRNKTVTNINKQLPPTTRNKTVTNINKQPPPTSRNKTVTNMNKQLSPTTRNKTVTNINKQPPPPSMNKTVTNINKQTPPPSRNRTVTNMNKQLPPTTRNKTVTNINKQPPPPSRNKTVTNVNKEPPGSASNMTVTNITKKPPSPWKNVTWTNTNKPSPGPSWKVPGGVVKHQPSACDIRPPHQAALGWNGGSGNGSKSPPPYSLPGCMATGHPEGHLGYLWSRGLHPHGSSQWSPPGYTSSYSMMPGLFSVHGGLSSTSYHSIPFGYSKNFFKPSSPTIILSPITHYYYPSSIPLMRTWGCDCYVKNRTALCTYKLKDNHIPSCVNSSVTALYIRSEKVDRLIIDAFSHVPHLQYLNITGTMLISLPRDLFYDTRGLKHLLVQKNPSLRSLDKDVFTGASKLEDVILDHNNISSLEQDVFIHLTNVKRLNLAYNKIRSLPKGIFRDNRELQELGLSGNPLHISSDTARDLLRNNTKLRVLLMRKCNLKDLPDGLLRNASNLEWLDLSHNKISKFPSEFIQDCTKLAYLGVAYNKLKVLGSDVLYLHGGSFATLGLEGNPWHCDCHLLPLAGWASLRKDAVPGWPKCSSPNHVERESLQCWFHSKGAIECGGASSSLRADLNLLLSVCRAIAEGGPVISDDEVSLTATHYFLYATVVRTDTDVNSTVWHWTRFLEKVLHRRRLHYIKEKAKKVVGQISNDRTVPLLKKVNKELLGFKLDIGVDSLVTNTTKLPADRGTEWSKRPKGFEPLVNFTYIMKNIPENLTKVVDVGIEEELKILFGVINGTNVTHLNTTPPNASVLNATGPNGVTSSAGGTAVLSKEMNTTERLVASLRAELREVLATLLLSIDRAKWDAAEQDFIKEEEERAQKPPSTTNNSADVGSWILKWPQIMILVAVLTLLALALVYLVYRYEHVTASFSNFCTGDGS